MRCNKYTFIPSNLRNVILGYSIKTNKNKYYEKVKLNFYCNYRAVYVL